MSELISVALGGRPASCSSPKTEATLSMDEQARFRSAHDMAMRDPALAATRQRYEQARNEYRNKLREALLKADPSVQPILEKVRRKREQDQRHQDR